MDVPKPDPWEMQCLSVLINVETARALSRPASHRPAKLTEAAFNRLEAYVRDHIPPLSNAFRYSMATDFLCSSVKVSLVSAMISPV
ncbi:hypothetical protein OKW34_002787 [Paraburkholderia youngii]|uniref:hypothetical protein n=1 Tax=Paraburkholderia youngii TaxID=2782701 RepID=UPI003D1E0948